jgi:hypothetical protein
MARREFSGGPVKPEGILFGLEDDRDPEMLARTRRTDDGEAFMPDPEDGPAMIGDDLAETLAEEFVRSALTGNNTGDEAMDDFVAEEIGGPFVETSASEEFGDGPDGNNPEGTTREPMPRAVSGLAQEPPDEY